MRSAFAGLMLGLWLAGAPLASASGLLLCYGRALRSELLARGPDASPDAFKDALKEAFAEATFTTPAENQAWIDAALGGGRGVFLDVENSALKRLNDELKDKNLVSALTHLYQSILFEKIDGLAADAPGVRILPYSDYKSARFAFVGEVPRDLPARIDGAYRAANAEFERMAGAFGVRTRPSEPWFLAGIGDTSDQANLAARYGRQSRSPPRLRAFWDEKLATDLRAAARYLESYRAEIAGELRGTPLLEPVPGHPELELPSAEVFNLHRKAASGAELQSFVKRSFGIELNEDRIENLRIYMGLVDEFSPGIWIAKREHANLDRAAHGGLSADIAGMGAVNARATAESLAVSGDRLDDLLKTIRAGEREVSREFERQRGRFKAAVGEAASGVETVCSGDDCVAIPREPLTASRKRALVGALAREGASTFRLSFVPEGVSDGPTRTLLAVQGEAIEKHLRRELLGKLP